MAYSDSDFKIQIRTVALPPHPPTHACFLADFQVRIASRLGICMMFQERHLNVVSLLYALSLVSQEIFTSGYSHIILHPAQTGKWVRKTHRKNRTERGKKAYLLCSSCRLRQTLCVYFTFEVQGAVSCSFLACHKRRVWQQHGFYENNKARKCHISNGIPCSIQPLAFDPVHRHQQSSSWSL